MENIHFTAIASLKRHREAFTKLTQTKSDSSLPREKRGLVKIVKSEAEWKLAAKQNIRAARRWGCVSLDLEHKITRDKTKSSWDRLKFILVGFPHGEAVCFDVEAMRRVMTEAEKRDHDFKDLVPADLKNLLAGGDVITLGSDIFQEWVDCFEPRGLDIHYLCDTQELYRQLTMMNKVRGAYNKDGSRNWDRNGMGQQSMEYYGVNLKPFGDNKYDNDRTKFERTFGKQPVPRGAWWRDIWGLYAWTKTDKQETTSYLLNDSMTPMATAFHMAEAAYETGMFSKVGNELTLANLVKAALYPYTLDTMNPGEKPMWNLMYHRSDSNRILEALSEDAGGRDSTDELLHRQVEFIKVEHEIGMDEIMATVLQKAVGEAVEESDDEVVFIKEEPGLGIKIESVETTAANVGQEVGTQAGTEEIKMEVEQDSTQTGAKPATVEKDPLEVTTTGEPRALKTEEELTVNPNNTTMLIAPEPNEEVDLDVSGDLLNMTEIKPKKEPEPGPVPSTSQQLCISTPKRPHPDAEGGLEHLTWSPVAKVPKREETEKKKNLNVKQSRGMEPRVTLDQQALRPTPSFNQRCRYCAKTTHYDHDNLGRITCTEVPKYKNFYEATGKRLRICDYNLCPDPNMHLTRACPELQSRCQNCQFRGHRFETFQKCDPLNADTMETMRESFEEVAGRGNWTHLKDKLVHFGFYPVNLDLKPDEHLAEYPKLKSRPVLEAADYVWHATTDMAEGREPAPLERGFKKYKLAGGDLRAKLTYRKAMKKQSGKK